MSTTCAGRYWNNIVKARFGIDNLLCAKLHVDIEKTAAEEPGLSGDSRSSNTKVSLVLKSKN